MQTLKENGIEMIIATGSALLRNPILQKEFTALYPLPVEYEPYASSPYGAALCMAQILKHSSNYLQ